MFKRILLATDFSPHAEVAKQIAQALAQGEDKQLWALTVVEPLEEPLAEVGEPPMVATQEWQSAVALSEKEMEQERRFRLTQDMTELEAAGTHVTSMVRVGDPAEEILTAAKEIRADLIVMGSHSNRTFWDVVLGSVTEKVAKQAPCPVLIVSHRPPHPATVHQRILFATDFSPHAEMAFRVALSLAKEEDQQLWLLTVIAPGEEIPMSPGFAVETPYPRVQELEAESRVEVEAKAQQRLNGLVAQAKELGIRAETLIRRGNAAKEICKAAVDLDADLIVLGSHSRRNIWDVLLGNTAENVSRRAYCPVLIVSHLPGNNAHSGEGTRQ